MSKTELLWKRAGTIREAKSGRSYEIEIDGKKCYVHKDNLKELINDGKVTEASILEKEFRRIDDFE